MNNIDPQDFYALLRDQPVGTHLHIYSPNREEGWRRVYVKSSNPNGEFCWTRIPYINGSVPTELLCQLVWYHGGWFSLS